MTTPVEPGDVRQVVERLRWLADRVQQENPDMWSERAMEYSRTQHDRIACADIDHAGCHKFALVETARRTADLLLEQRDINRTIAHQLERRADGMDPLTKDLRERVEKAEADLETERMRLAACATAATTNVRVSIDHPWHSPAYAEVCAALDRLKAAENHREEFDAALDVAHDALNAMGVPRPQGDWSSCAAFIGARMSHLAATVDNLRAALTSPPAPSGCLLIAQWRKRADGLFDKASEYPEGDRERMRYNTIAGVLQACAAELEIAPSGWQLAERIAQLTAHRVCLGAEHDPASGKIHGTCVVCGDDWPCPTALLPAPTQEHTS